MRILPFIPILWIAALSLSAPVFACGGGILDSLDDVMESADLVVSARVDYVDALGENAVLHVDRYFKGSGGEYLAVVGTRPAWFVGDSLRDYTNGCYNFGAYGFKFRKDSVGYFALHARTDGTYSYSETSVWILGDVHPARKLKATDGLIEIDSFIPDEYEMDYLQPAAEFEKFLLRQSNRSYPSAPEPSAYPLMRFINITTESRTRYRLNPDRSVTQIDLDKSPEASSNDGSHVMFRLDQDELGFQYIERVKKPFHFCAYNLCLGSAATGGRTLSTVDYSTYGYLEPIKGLYAKFSPDSNFVAVQEREQIVVYMFNNWVEEQYGYGQHMTMTRVAEQSFWQETDGDERLMQWSSDSTSIAYQDDAGIWRWNIFEETYPRLVLLTDSDKRLIDVSRSGRYVRYSSGDTWYLVNVESEDVYERAIATPDERNIITIISGYADDVPTQRPERNTYSEDRRRMCNAPISECPVHLVYREHLIDYFEYRPGWIGLVSPQSISLHPWYLSSQHSHFQAYVSYEQPIVAFDYDNTYGRPAVAVGDYMIDLGYIPDLSINSAKEERADFVDLSERLDSPIADLEWEQSVFVDR
ncbi:MAG: hypothetical protein OXG39_11280 [Chloroflexi bacterium]|nr:hypothetical protein [Chloroflexota bacterium]